MSQLKVTLDKLTFTFEDLAKIDLIIGELPYKVVKPIYDIINLRVKEQGEAKLQEIESQKTPSLDKMPLRDKG